MSRILAPLILIAALLAGWELACKALAVPAYLLPPPSAIWEAFVASWPLLLGSAWATLSTALLALIIASLIACGLALLVSLNGFLEDAVRPIAVTLQVTPLVAIAPLVTIWAGIDHPERAVIGLAAVVAFFPIFSGALSGLKSVDPDLARLFDLYGATPLQRLVRLRLPSAVPALLEGHKVAAGLAVIGAVVAEFVAGSGGAQGLAWRILESYNRLQTAKVFAALFTLALLGVVLHAAMEALERRLLNFWRGR
ncbi:ABC transporter permease [Caulobacter vibrioides]|uniref:ABC transporter, permease protein, putative n=2 Tax=Caulobacter vibrioides TaxID=155892 RepID=Q9A534_CAUVC|nr:ABC transporter permease [Caulobacter vibrioides]YP_002518091.1 ABC transporter ATP-binding protein [Caulobacter vibrioides NA1000]AAK24602.1 ABC transporter, permease protein, putative [Caulobacter vibrioides CB15]ACL96183.1 ABC transporter ATP-binding protein [Caulobacter vibrioides NA1000]ATC29478.1 ABC transporter permease [Caulobacter vibrioides]QXZ50997.1 ABC transporter permease [Caulobacter vibrioides]